METGLSQVALYFAQQSFNIEKGEGLGDHHGFMQRAMNRDKGDKYSISSKQEALVMLLYHPLLMQLTRDNQSLLIEYENVKLKQFILMTKAKLFLKYPKPMPSQPHIHIWKNMISI